MHEQLHSRGGSVPALAATGDTGNAPVVIIVTYRALRLGVGTNKPRTLLRRQTPLKWTYQARLDGLHQSAVGAPRHPPCATGSAAYTTQTPLNSLIRGIP
jgi:hypothetical protein